MARRKWCLAMMAAAFAPMVALTAPGCSSGQPTTGSVTKPPEAAAGEKASFEFMKKNMTRGGFTKKAAAPRS